MPDIRDDVPRASVTVGVVGPGRMGLPIIHQLAQAGHDVRVYVRPGSRTRRIAPPITDPLVRPADGLEDAPVEEPLEEKDTAELVREAGASVVADLRETVVGAEVVIICLFSQPQVDEVLLGSGALMNELEPGTTLVCHTSLGPRFAAGLVEAAAARGIDVVDALLDGTPHDLSDGKCNIILGASDSAKDKVAPLLALYGDPLLHVGGPVAGHWTKLIQEYSLATHYGVIENAAHFAKEVGLDPASTLEALSMGTAGSVMMTHARSFDQANPAAFVDFCREFLAKDVLNYHEDLSAHGLDAGLLGRFALAVANDSVREHVSASAT